MGIAYGPVVSKKVKKKNTSGDSDVELIEDLPPVLCFLCKMVCTPNEILKCLVKDCDMEAHTICLAEHFLRLEVGHLLPLSGSCPKCDKDLLWGDLIRKKKGCYQQLGEEEDFGSLSDYETEILA